jgi:Arylsulfotransferase (ASST)
VLYRSLYAFFAFVWITDILYAQRTLGLIENTDEAYDGYTLFAPISSKETYLIDNCGYVVNTWVSNHLPGQTAYLLENGDLLRTARVPGFFTGGGLGGKIEIFTWEGNLKWSKTFATESYHHHHVAYPLPNGNILAILWKKYAKDEAIQKGFNPQKITDRGIWSDKIIEFKPLLNDGLEIVWEWDFWDHTIQNIDSSKNNFGKVADHPELLDVNFFEDPGPNEAEWLHANSLDYHPALDQILVSSKFHNEFYIIDHSTTTAEAKGHTGGKYGKGGDFLYRWGNPRSYSLGSEDDHWLYGQHDVQWIKNGLPGENNILLFNNGSNRKGALYSTVEELTTPVTQAGNYISESGAPYMPTLPLWIYQSNPKTDFYSSRISGAQRLPNGNTLICEGNDGKFFEVNQSDKMVWQYINPINNFGQNVQGSSPINTDVFKVTRYSKDFPGFHNRNMTGTTTLEINQEIYDCNKTSASDDLSKQNITFYPNPATDKLYIGGIVSESFQYIIRDINGKIIKQDNCKKIGFIHTESLLPSIYSLQIYTPAKNNSINFVFIKI